MLVLLIFIASFRAHGAFEKIWQGYLGSDTKFIRDTGIDLAQERFIYDSAFTFWNLELSVTHNETAIKNLNAFNPDETIVDTYSAKLTRPTINYGTYSLEHVQAGYDLSNWQPGLNQLPSDQQYDVRTILRYSYDFLNRNSEIQADLIEAQFQESYGQAQFEREQEYLQFFTKFIEAKLSLFQVRFGRENAEQAKRRINFIKSRLKSGYSKAADLYLAQSVYYGHKENIEKAKRALEENLSKLEFIVGYKFTEETLGLIDWEKIPVESKVEPLENWDLKYTKARVELATKSLTKLKNDFSHSLKLNLSYETNGIQDNRSEALYDNFQEDKNQIVSIVYSIPFGGDRSGSLRRQLELEKKLREKQLANKKGEIENTFETLREQIGHTRQALKFARSKAKSFFRAHQEIKKLYSRGTRSFEDTIQSEENYNNAKLNEKATLANLELLIANKEFLKGNIKGYLDNYRD